jgi:hypothetical protein
MKNFEFQIVCINCGCLAIKIEDPVRAPREATVYCGDCGAARGTVGALRDLAVQTNSNVPTRSQQPPKNGRTTNDPHSGGEISERYDELQRLRQQVKMAESLALKSQKRQFLLTAFAGGLGRPFHTRSPRDVPSGS